MTGNIDKIQELVIELFCPTTKSDESPTKSDESPTKSDECAPVLPNGFADTKVSEYLEIHNETVEKFASADKIELKELTDEEFNYVTDKAKKKRYCKELSEPKRKILPELAYKDIMKFEKDITREIPTVKFDSVLDGIAKLDILGTAESSGIFKTLSAALEAAELVDALKSDGPFTVFAPTDDAFAKLPEGTLEGLLKQDNKEQLQKILKYHVVNGALISKDLPSGKTKVKALNEKDIYLKEVKFKTFDIQCINGVIHIIDEVLIIPNDAALKKIKNENERDNMLDNFKDIVYKQDPSVWEGGCIPDFLHWIKNNIPKGGFYVSGGVVTEQPYVDKLIEMKEEFNYSEESEYAQFWIDLWIGLYQNLPVKGKAVEIKAVNPTEEGNDLDDDDKDEGADGDTVIIADGIGAALGSVFGPVGSAFYCALYSIVENNR